MIWTRAQSAIVLKDIRESTLTKGAKASVMLIPLLFGIILPLILSILTFVLNGITDTVGSIDGLKGFDILLNAAPEANSVALMYSYLINYLMPTFFVIIPMMVACVAGGSCVVGERERHTLPTLIYSPMSIKQLFAAKVTGALATSMLVTFATFIGFMIIVGVSCFILGSFVLDIGIWAAVMLVISPAISLVGITLMVLVSARAHTFQEAQQYSMFLMIPTMALFMIPLESGSFLFDAPKLLIFGAVLIVLAVVLLRMSSVRFTAEKLLK